MNYKRIALIALTALLAMGLGAQTTMYLPRAEPYLPQIWAQGGSATAVAEGYTSLFTNPAGIKGKNEFSLSASAWAIGNPVDIGYFLGVASEELINAQLYKSGGAYDPGFEPMSKDDSVANIIKFAEKGLSQGLGAGSQASIGLTAGGLGLAANVVADAFMTGANALDVKGFVTVNASLVAGLALDVLKLSDDFVLTVGGDVRPNIRYFTPLKATSLFDILSIMDTDPGMAEILNALGDMHQSIGMGIDLGAKLKMGPFTVGLSIRDLFGTKYNSYKMPMGDFVTALDSGSIPDVSELGTEDDKVAWYVPMNITLGAAWRPFYNSGLKSLIDPVVHVDLADPFKVINEQLSPWALLHVGAEAKLLGGLLSARLGLNQGYVTAGAGIHLIFIDVNASIFTRELGSYAGDKPSMGMSVEAALRF